MQTAIRNNGQVMPLLMNFTPATPIEEDNGIYNVIYDDVNQIVYDYNMRTVGTYSLKIRNTKKPTGKSSYTSHADKKNEIDDSKSVK